MIRVMALSDRVLAAVVATAVGHDAEEGLDLVNLPGEIKIKVLNLCFELERSCVS